jgi:hypothetical protein
MELNMNQKFAARGRAVPLLWRDCAWRVRIFVRTRIGAKRPMALGRLLVGRDIPGLPGLKIWTTGPRRCNGWKRSARSTGCRRTAAVSKTSRRDGKAGYPIENPLRLVFDTAAIRLAGKGYQGRGGAHSCRAALQPKSCVPVRVAHNLPRKHSVTRLQPVLAFAASQLGGIELSRLKIYSVFQ